MRASLCPTKNPRYYGYTTGLKPSMLSRSSLLSYAPRLPYRPSGVAAPCPCTRIFCSRCASGSRHTGHHQPFFASTQPPHRVFNMRSRSLGLRLHFFYFILLLQIPMCIGVVCTTTTITSVVSLSSLRLSPHAITSLLTSIHCIRIHCSFSPAWFSTRRRPAHYRRYPASLFGHFHGDAG